MKTNYQFFFGVAVSVFMLFFGVFLMAAPGLFSSAAEARSLTDQADLPRTITVVGEGQVRTEPDIARVTIGMQVADPDVKAVTDQAAQSMQSLLAVLKEEGIAQEDIQTAYYNVYVDRPFGPGGGNGEILYQVSNNMQVTIRDLDRVAPILGKAIEAGANNINSVNFSLADPTALRAEARQLAVEDARATAEELAGLNDVAVGEVVSVSEVIERGGMYVSELSAPPYPVGGGGAGPISPGDVNVNVQLQITYTILR